MATKNPRVNVTLDPVTYRALRRVSSRSGRSLSDVIRTLMLEAMEIQEDAALARVAEERRQRARKPLSHLEVWGA